jgi:hypothetical protein
MKKQLQILLPELKNKKFRAQYMKREKTLYIEIYTETNERFIFDKKTIKYQGELQSIMRELKLKALGI